MLQEKVFIYLTRVHESASQLLVFESHDEPGFEVPKGSVEPGESLSKAVQRELLEEAGITTIRIHKQLGSSRWQNEQQHFYLVEGAADLPDCFEHTVTGLGIDSGFRYHFQWLPVHANLTHRLVQGCNRFVGELLEHLQALS